MCDCKRDCNCAPPDYFIPPPPPSPPPPPPPAPPAPKPRYPELPEYNPCECAGAKAGLDGGGTMPGGRGSFDDWDEGRGPALPPMNPFVLTGESPWLMISAIIAYDLGE